eukprot:TRINITY_DN6489_c0_g1_i5.p1 TRINITY_DN6489_c0_g1~~TRINITY_DN6489_c0_g1_i5.p1  ORF type:complete len:219 (+),score=52.19 TRINITY_DN6489_c0_g1_i5:34-690(+)
MNSSDDDGESEYSWINWFCDLEGHEFFCEVDEDFINDNFNLYGLRPLVPKYSEALNMILSPESPDSEEANDQSFLEIYQSALDLYGMIHARFILTTSGLQIMKQKYLAGTFGVCPRLLCESQGVLPIGLSDELNKSRVKAYCPRCEDAYYPKIKADIDGAYFGTAFPHMLLQAYPNLVPKEGAPPYIPRIYGFRIFGQRGSKYGLSPNLAATTMNTGK